MKKIFKLLRKLSIPLVDGVADAAIKVIWKTILIVGPSLRVLLRGIRLKSAQAVR